MRIVTVALFIVALVVVVAIAAAQLEPPTVRWLGHPVAVPLADCDEDADECVPGIYSTIEIGLLDDGTVVWRPARQTSIEPTGVTAGAD